MSARILPLESHPSLSAHRAEKSPWIPTDRDRVIFQWVRFDGRTQEWVAQQLEISQSTVSRIVERYERWIARGGPGASGGLSDEEQVRYQRWLTYERNERILASCLRIATDLERQIDISRTTITKNNLSPSAESEVKTYYEVLDRTASAAKFLRLAFRINLEQKNSSNNPRYPVSPPSPRTKPTVSWRAGGVSLPVPPRPHQTAWPVPI